MNYLLIIVIGYLIGNLHGSLIIGKLKNIDIKNAGVKNAGASNTTILLGWKYGIIVALIDIFKAVFAVLLAKHLLSNSFVFFDIAYLVGAAVIIGHIFPFVLKFNGGKGTASIIGMFFAIDFKIGLVSLATLIIVSLITNYLVIGVFVYYFTVGIFTYINALHFSSLCIVLILTCISVIKHIENIKRILNKTEKTISSMFNKT